MESLFSVKPARGHAYSAHGIAWVDPWARTESSRCHEGCRRSGHRVATVRSRLRTGSHGHGVACDRPARVALAARDRKLCDILGYTRESCSRSRPSTYPCPKERHLAIAYNEQLLRGDLSSYSREKRYLRKGGGVVWTNIWLSAVLDSDGQPAQVIMVIEDITERKDAEIAGQEAENRFRSVVDSSPAGITLKDRDGRFLVVNRTYARG